MIDLNEALDVAKLAAKKASDRILEGFEEDLAIEEKMDASDRVTQVDTDAQRIIQETIATAYPGHGFLGEEDHEIVDGDGEYRWVVDPIDGTNNFIQRLPHTGVSIALQHDGETVVGVQHFPVFSHVYSAVKGQGAFLNDKPIHVSSCSALKDAVITELYSDRHYRGTSVQLPPCLSYRKFGAATLSLAYVASGKIDGTGLRCRLWDLAAAMVIISEAGGQIEWWSDDEHDERAELTCIAATPGVFKELKEFAEAVIK